MCTPFLQTNVFSDELQQMCNRCKFSIFGGPAFLLFAECLNREVSLLLNCGEHVNPPKFLQQQKCRIIACVKVKSTGERTYAVLVHHLEINIRTPSIMAQGQRIGVYYVIIVEITLYLVYIIYIQKYLSSKFVLINHNVLLNSTIVCLN